MANAAKYDFQLSSDDAVFKMMSRAAFAVWCDSLYLMKKSSAKLLHDPSSGASCIPATALEETRTLLSDGGRAEPSMGVRRRVPAKKQLHCENVEPPLNICSF